jgi:excinuclease ABC subunit A
MQKPDVDSIEGLSPAISIEQKTTSKNPCSTVGTVTDVGIAPSKTWKPCRD